MGEIVAAIGTCHTPYMFTRPPDENPEQLDQAGRGINELGKALAEIVKGRKERVAIIASGGMSHFPGTTKYLHPEFDFDRWLLSQFEVGNINALLDMSGTQLDEVGNTEMLSWAVMFGAIG